MNLPEQFCERMKERLGNEYPAFLQTYKTAPKKGLRVNALKVSAEEFVLRAPFPLGEKVEEEENGFFVEQEKAGADPYHFAGLYYMQEPSAMCAVPLFKDALKKPDVRVLDLCAAPGGKTSQLAARMQGRGILVSNEVNLSRAQILSENVERMGIKNCAVLFQKPEILAMFYKEYFDCILVDAPCSGEGMFKKEPNAVKEWSGQNVLYCAARQKQILDRAAEMLAGGGTLVYSTCTFSEEEDEWQIREFLARHKDFSLQEMKKIYPHSGKGEGHFAAALIRTEGGRGVQKPYPVRREPAAEKAFFAFAREFFVSPPAGEITTLEDGRMFLIPQGMPQLKAYALRVGVELGEWRKGVFRPAHALAMSMKREECKRYISLSREECERYLAGQTVGAELTDGWCVVGVEDYPLGIGKAVGGTIKNHLPKALRKHG